MPSKFERYKQDLKDLIERGDNLFHAMEFECHPKEFKKVLKDALKDEAKAEAIIKALPSFRAKFQSWYSEAKPLIKQLLPDRVDDFVRLYEKPKARKSITFANYVIEDYLQSLSVTDGLGGTIVDPSAAIRQFEQQANILKSLERRFESSLYDIQALVQADIFDSELAAARELLKNKFTRAAGAMSGVVLERHLEQTCRNHNLPIKKANPTINDLNSLLKDNGIIDVAQWRFIQHLADIRNLCDHNKKQEPTNDQIEDLITGVDKITKTLS